MLAPAFLSCLSLSHPSLRLPATHKRRSEHPICCSTAREAAPARAHLLSLLNPATDRNAVHAAIQKLLALRAPPHPEDPLPRISDLDGEIGNWRAGFSGRWDLAFSTEPLLRSIVFDKDGKPNKHRCAFQLVDSGSGELQNVIVYGRDAERPLVLLVVVKAELGEETRRCDYVFEQTNILYGREARDFLREREMASGTGIDVQENGWGFNIKLPFAVGKGFFRAVWLDEVVRVDEDTSTGEVWLNVYLYGGPMVKCGMGNEAA